MNKVIKSSVPFILSVILLGLFSCSERKEDVKAEEVVPDVLYFSNFQLDSILNAALGDTTPIQNLGAPTTIAQGKGGESYLLIKRTVAGYVELHEQWDDVVIIHEGHGVLRTGRTVTDNKLWNGEEPWRNWYGGSINDVIERKISPGDFIVIPAMTAHQYVPDENDTLAYWTIKIKRERGKIDP